MEETIVFIDGGFLSKLSKHFGDGKYLSYDIIKLSKNLARKQGLECKHIFYYIAPPFQSTPIKEDERLRKERYDKFIKKLIKNKIITVREGRCQRLINGFGEFKFSQKAVDSLIIMDLMSVPIKYPLIKSVILIVCDSDFVPVIKYLKEINIKVTLFTYYEKKRDTNFSRSNDLVKIASKYVLISKEDFLNAPLNKSN